MIKHVLLFFVFISFSVSANDFFRADSRTPDEIRRAGGLLPRGQQEAYERGTPININLYEHARGTVTGNTRYNDGYVSTTTTLRQAHLIGQNILGSYNEYYIYVVAPAPNLFDVNGVLGRYSPYPSENEFAALGGIPLSQIIGWYRVSFGAIEGECSETGITEEIYFKAYRLPLIMMAIISQDFQRVLLHGESCHGVHLLRNNASKITWLEI